MNGNTKPLAAITSSTTAYIVGSQTLVPGAPAITVSGTTISLETDGSSVVAGGSTQALGSFLGSSTGTAVVGGLGGVIATIGGFAGGADPSSNGSYDGPAFLGGAERCAGGFRVFWRWLLIVGIGWVVI